MKFKEETAEQAAYKWVFETNRHKWSNNNYESGDNFNSFVQGYKIGQQKCYSEEDIMMVIERVIYLKNGWTPERYSFYKDDNEIKEEVMNLLKNK